MISYTLRQLAYFIAAAEYGSVAEAARRLHISQPSVSLAIAKLEGHFGVQLLLRHQKHGVSLTEAGESLVAEAKRLLHHADAFDERAKGLGQDLKGRLQVGCFITITPHFMPSLVMGFTAAYPEIDLRVDEGQQDELIEGLESSRISIALLYDDQLGNHIEVRPLEELPPYAVLPADHPLASRKAVSLAELSGEPMILLDVSPSRDYFTSLFRDAGLEPNIRFRSPSFEMVRGMVGHGFGYSLLITRPQGDITYDGRKLACVTLEDDVRPGRIVLARLASMQPTRLMQVFTDHCEKHFA